MNKKTVTIIATGGSIACSTGERGLKPTFKLSEMLAELPEMYDLATIRPIQLMNKDSSDMQPEDWIKIAVQAFKELQYSDAVVITHGTDTMAYTSSVLSFMIQNMDKPVIITGSQRPWNEKETDAKHNLLDAVRVAVSGAQNNIKGIYIVFHGKIIKGCRAKKSKFLERSELDAFDTVNYPLVGLVKEGHLMLNPILVHTNGNHGQPKLDTKITNEVLMLMLAPGFNPEILDMIKGRIKGIIIQAYGLGNMPIHGRVTLLPKIKEWVDEGKVVAVTSQACYETDLSQYEVGEQFLRIGVIPTLDMTQESAYTKLMWALGHSTENEKIREMIWHNYAGEIWPIANGGNPPRDIMGEMARYHELTRRLYESNTQLMMVMGEIFGKISVASQK